MICIPDPGRLMPLLGLTLFLGLMPLQGLVSLPDVSPLHGLMPLPDRPLLMILLLGPMPLPGPMPLLWTVRCRRHAVA